LLGGWAALALAACTPSAPPPPPPKPRPPPDLQVAHLGDLLTAVGLEWLVLARPDQVLAIDWLRPALSRLLRQERLDLLARATGIDLRRAPDLALASYAPGGGNDSVIAYFVRHRHHRLEVERKFRERLTSEAVRSVEGHQLVASWGKIGLAERALGAIGPDIAAFQYGGDRRRGPVRIAILYAQGKLTVPTVKSDPVLGELERALGDAPLRALLPGPFEGEMARGARGLLAAADAIGATLSPTPARSLRLEVLLAGDFEAHPDSTAYLEGAWQDLAKSDLGHLLGLHRSLAPAVASATRAGLRLRAELDASELLRGLAAATIDDVRAIMQ
jgi:hypothetical protein